MTEVCDVCGRECKNKHGLYQHKKQSHENEKDSLLDKWKGDSKK